MRIRTQLVIAFLLLAVFPLTGIVLYSYFTSLEAVKGALEAEAQSLASQMDRRMGTIKRDLRERVERVGEAQFSRILQTAGTQKADSEPAVVDEFVGGLGEVAALVDSLEFTPTAHAGTGGVHPVPPIPPTPTVVIDLEAIMREARGSHPALTPETERQIAEDIRRSVRDAAAVEGIVLRGIDLPNLTGSAAAAGATQVSSGSNAAPSAAAALPNPPARPIPAPSPHPVATPGTLSVQRVTVDSEGSSQTAPATTAAATPSSRTVRSKVLSPVTEEEARRIAAQARANAALARETAKRVKLEKEESKRLTVPVERMIEKRREMKLLLGREFAFPVRKEGEIVGEVKAQVSAKEVVHRVLAATPAGDGEIPFAVDSEGTIYTANERDRTKLGSLPIAVNARAGGPRSRQIVKNWVVATSKDGESGLTFGIARPIRDSIEQVRRTAGQNFIYGLSLIGLALLGIIPIANHMTRDVQLVTAGAERIAAGNLEVEVPVRSRSEFGQLAAAFNRMAGDLRRNQVRLLEEERRGRDQEIHQRLLTKDIERKTEELEEARRFQLSLLPKRVPQHDAFRIAVFMKTATEVGGDYYDFHHASDGSLTIAIGDATGHGARAGTMVTVIKSLFSSYTSELGVSEFLVEAAETIKRMDLGRVSMALALAKLEGMKLTVSAAGMPPLLVYRPSTRQIEEIAVEGMPLGTRSYAYTEQSIDLHSGDTILLMSDGFPELQNPQGDPLGYPSVQERFGRVAAQEPEGIIAALAAEAEAWTGNAAPGDDITFVVVRVV